MNIENLINNQNYNLSESVNNRLNGIESFDFELEMPENYNFAELFNSSKSDNSDQNISFNSLEQLQSKLMKNLQITAEKDNIRLKTRNIKDIRLLIYAHDLLNTDNSYKIKLDSLNDNDITFLKQFTSTPNITIDFINTQNLQASLSFVNPAGQVSYKSFNVSKGLSDIIEYAYKVQRPVRLDFEGNSSIILKINNEGKLSAEFMSSNIAMEYILKNSIPHLRNKLDSEGIPYKEIIYKDRNKKRNPDEQERR